VLLQSQERLNELIHGGPRQRAEALAALNSAFKSSSVTKKITPRPSANGRGSQRAAAVAALSSVLTAENKQSPDASPVASRNRSPIPESSLSGNNCSFLYASRMLHTMISTTVPLSFFP
jgi:gelsolin